MDTIRSVFVENTQAAQSFFRLCEEEGVLASQTRTEVNELSFSHAFHGVFLFNVHPADRLALCNRSVYLLSVE